MHRHARSRRPSIAPLSHRGVAACLLLVLAWSPVVETPATGQLLQSLLRKQFRDAQRARIQQRRAEAIGQPYDTDLTREEPYEVRARAAADSPVDPAIFLPPQAEEMNTYLSARATAAEAMQRRCQDAVGAEGLAQQRARGFRPLPAAEQIRMGQEGTARYEACAAEARAYFQVPMDQLRISLTQWAAALPPDYEGLRALSKARSSYNYVWGRVAPGSMTQKVGNKVAPVANPIFDGRTSEIERTVRPRLMADLRRPGGTALLDDLFLGDRARQQGYRTTLASAERSEQQSALAARFAAPAPIAVKLRQALVQSFARTPNARMAEGFGMLRVSDDSVAYDIPAISTTYRFDVTDASCAAAVKGARRCSYKYRLTVGANLFGLAPPSAESPWVPRTYSFTTASGSLRSTALDQEMVALAAAGGGGGSSGTSMADRAREDRIQRCNDRIFSDLSSGDMSSAAARSIVPCM